MELVVENLQKRIRIHPSQIKRIANLILTHEKIKSASLSFVFVSRQKIKAFNKQFLKRDYTTDVLAFDLRDRHQLKKKILLGDIIISTDAAIAHAKIYNTSVKYELSLYVIHGILHLLGYDDHSTKDVARMRKKEKELLKHCKIIR